MPGGGMGNMVGRLPGVGGGAGGGLAAGGMALGPWGAAATGIFFGAMSIMGARAEKKRMEEQVRAIEEAAYLKQENVNAALTQARVDSGRHTIRLSEQLQQEMGDIMNQSERVGEMVGMVTNRLVRPAVRDQFAIDEEMRRRERAAASQRQAIAAEANAQSFQPQSELMAGLTGAFQGAQMFSEVSSLMNGLARQKTLNSAAQSTYPMYERDAWLMNGLARREVDLQNSYLDAATRARQYWESRL